MANMFSLGYKLHITGLNKFDTTQVTDMSYMFNYLQQMGNFDIKNFNTENVNSMKSMFSRCQVV